VLVKRRAPVRLTGNRTSLRTGQWLRFRGRLLHGPIPPQGVLVEIQARRITGWQTFGTTRANHKGRFHYRYRFSRTLGVQRYSFRARVPRQPTYPYAAGISKRFSVRVAG
jgi:hypothetical protein